MIKPGHNRLDLRRTLTPRDYLTQPHHFGQDQPVLWHLPAAGDPLSLEIAKVLHALVRQWRQRGCRPSGSQLATAFGFSSSTWSRTVLGERWAGETVLIALLDALRRAPGS